MMLLAIPISAQGATAVATWSYPDGTTDLAGFAIYRETEKIATITDPAARKYESLVITDTGNACYTMTAFDTGGQESPHSPCFNFDPPPDAPGDVRVTVVVEVRVVQP